MPARRQTPAEKRQADRQLIVNGIELTETFLRNHPTHQNAEQARRNLALLQSKLAAMGA